MMMGIEIFELLCKYVKYVNICQDRESEICLSSTEAEGIFTPEEIKLLKELK